MLRTNRIIAAVLLAAGVVSIGPQFSAADDKDKKAPEDPLQAAEAKLRALEVQVKEAQDNYERLKKAHVAQKDAAMRARLQALDWTLEAVGRTGDKVTLKVNHSNRLYLADLPVAWNVRVHIDNGPGNLGGLKAGMRLQLELADQFAVAVINAFAEEPGFVVKEVDLKKEMLTVTREGKDFASGLYVGDASISIDNKPVDLKDLKPGMQVSLSFDVSRGQLDVRKVQARK